MTGRASTLPLALALALAACGGKEPGEDAPALLGTGIPSAAPGASGVQIDQPVTAPLGTGTRRVPVPEPSNDDPPLEDPFGQPAPPEPTPHPVAPMAPPSKGTHL
ncbi:MAG: hypothetical protein IT372_01785 [Polyangiaceae bacterium]|nr:hypothetical protein [Polyangiaceae bacterium]